MAVSGTTIIPTRDNERIAWSLNFEAEFPALAAQLGFTNAEMTALLQDSAAMRHAILVAQTGAAFSKACTAFKNGMLGGVGENQATPGIPVHNPPPLPPANVDAGIIERLSNAMAAAKKNAGYSQTIGETLQIVGSPAPEIDPESAKPVGTTLSMTGSIVRIEWTKGKFDGIYIESQRADETAWTNIGFDMRSPFDDERAPLVAGKPEERRYRLRFFIDNVAVGNYSDTLTAITLP